MRASPVQPLPPSVHGHSRTIGQQLAMRGTKRHPRLLSILRLWIACTLPCVLAAASAPSPRGLRTGLHPSLSRVGSGSVNTNPNGLPLIPAGQLLLDQDPHTTVIDSAISPSIPTYTRSIVFDPHSESVCVFLNNSKVVLPIHLSFPGGIPDLSQDVDMKYLPGTPWYNTAYQSAIIKPSLFSRMSLCQYANNNTLLPFCQVDITIGFGRSGGSGTVPFHLSIMQSPVLPWGVNPGPVGGTMGQLISYSMDAKQSDLPIVVSMHSEHLSNHMLYWWNARNPLQYFYPEWDEFQLPRDPGEEIDVWLNPTYGSKPAAPLTLPISTRKWPDSGGNARADPLYFHGPPSPILAGDNGDWAELYILGVWPLGDSQPSYPPDQHRFGIQFVRNFAVPQMDVNLGLSMFGVVGALTVLVLCLFSAAAIVIKRRSQANQLHVEEMAAIGIILRRRDGAEGAEGVPADRPAFDAEGRPLRYDAHGRLIPDLGAKKEVVAALPTRVYVSGMLPEEDAHCTICLGEYEAGETIKELPCAHVFHDACISKWLLQKGHCVLCQQKLSEAVPQGQAQARIINVAPAAAEVAAGEVAPLNARGSPAGAVGESPTASPYRGTQHSPEIDRSSWMRRDPDASGSHSSQSNGGGGLAVSHPLATSPRDRDLPSRSGPRSVAQPQAIILHYDDADPSATPQRAPMGSRSRQSEGVGGRQPTPPGSVNEAEGKEAEEERSERSLQSSSRSTQRQGGVTLVAVRPQS